MDQIYIPKKRVGMPTGSYVMIKPIETEPKAIKPFFYNITYLEPIKVKIIEEIFKTIDKYTKSENIIITGSFLEQGFNFNDIDIIIIAENSLNKEYISNTLKKKIGAKTHLIAINNKALLKGLSTDPLYRIMLSRCVAKKRLIYRPGFKVNYKVLDLHLLKSKLLINNFDFLTGNEKYEIVRNLIAISQFINKREITKAGIDIAIDNTFGANTVEKLKNNLLPKKDFLDKYRKIYINVQNKILNKIKNGSK